jgi:hypothetical protein
VKKKSKGWEEKSSGRGSTIYCPFGTFGHDPLIKSLSLKK